MSIGLGTKVFLDLECSKHVIFSLEEKNNKKCFVDYHLAIRIPSLSNLSTRHFSKVNQSII